MAQTYYVIELTLKWLILLLVGLALLMVLAFAGGYGAAWSVFRAGGSLETATPLTEIESVDVSTEATPGVLLSEATPVPPSAAPDVKGLPNPSPTKKVVPPATPVPVQKTGTNGPKKAEVKAPGKKTASSIFWVQVLASRHIDAIEKARRRLVEAGFPNDHHRVIESRAAGGTVLLKLRVGPFPDHASAERVRNRLQKKKFPDAWVVKP